MDLGPVSQGGDWIRRRELLLTRRDAEHGLPLRVAMRRERIISMSQVVRHIFVLVVRCVLGVRRCWPQNIPASPQSVNLSKTLQNGYLVPSRHLI
jgi:hypothetical protein